MKTTFFLLSLVITGSVFGQEIPKCLSPQYIEYQESLTPGFIKQVNNAFDNAKNFPVNQESKTGQHTIPVVVHIVHNITEENIPDSVIYNQIQILNEDYNRTNADTINMRPEFDIVKGSPNIQFVLAQIDENGLPTTGITRTQTATASFGSLLVLSGDFSDLEKVKSTANGGIDPWDQSRYLNIWVCDMSVFGITALLGYASPPAGLPNWPPGSTNGISDGVVIQYQAFGSNNPTPLDPGSGPIDVRGRTTVHEVGHYLGLRHIWGDGDCTAQDGIDDTPNADAQSESDCNPTKNTCTDNIQGIDLPDMIENFMDYSAETCQNSFTQGQVDLMYAVLEAERYNLVHGNPAAINEVNQQNISIYPNPSTDQIKITFTGEISSIEIIDLYGKVISKYIEPSNGIQVDISEFESGLYFVRYQLNAGVTGSQRIIKQ